MSEQIIADDLYSDCIYYKIICPAYNFADEIIAIEGWYAISKPIYNEVHRSMPHIVSSFFIEYFHDIRESS